jgi:hypothetical protein
MCTWRRTQNPVSKTSCFNWNGMYIEVRLHMCGNSMCGFVLYWLYKPWDRLADWSPITLIFTSSQSFCRESSQIDQAESVALVRQSPLKKRGRQRNPIVVSHCVGMSCSCETGDSQQGREIRGWNMLQNNRWRHGRLRILSRYVVNSGLCELKIGLKLLLVEKCRSPINWITIQNSSTVTWSLDNIYIYIYIFAILVDIVDAEIECNCKWRSTFYNKETVPFPVKYKISTDKDW